MTELKKRMCDQLLRGGHLKPYDVIRHSYTNDRINRRNGVGGKPNDCGNNICPTLDTRCDCLGVVTEEE